MPKPYRSKSRLVLDVLSAIEREQPVGVTRLLIVANLTHGRMQEHLGVMEQNGWIESTGAESRLLWQLTEKGRAILTELRRIDKAMFDFGLGI